MVSIYKNLNIKDINVKQYYILIFKDMDSSNFDINDFENLSDDALMDLVQGMDFDEDNAELNNDETLEEHNEKTICYSCDSTNIISDSRYGYIVCSDCGQVQDQLLDQNPEWNNYEDGKTTLARCSGVINPFLPQSSLGTSIAGNGRNKLQILHSWGMMPYKERSLYIVLKDIQAKCRDAFILKCVEDDAKIMYKNISNCKHLDGENKGKNIIIRGTNRKSLIAACVFFACKKNNKARSAKEIAKIFCLNYKDITKGCKKFMELSLHLKSILAIEQKSSSPEDFVPRFCKNLKIKSKYTDQAVKIAKNVKNLNIATTHTPLSIASASILLTICMNELTITKKYIANKFDVSEVTISKAYRSIEEFRDILNDDKKTLYIMKQQQKERDAIKLPPALALKRDKIISEQKKRLTQDNKDINIVIQSQASNGKIDTDDEASLSDISDCDIEKYDVVDYVDQIDLDLYEELGETEQEYTKLSQS